MKLMIIEKDNDSVGDDEAADNDDSMLIVL